MDHSVGFGQSKFSSVSCVLQCNEDSPVSPKKARTMVETAAPILQECDVEEGAEMKEKQQGKLSRFGVLFQL